MFEGRVLPLGLLPDDDAVDVVVPALHVGQRLHVYHVRVQVQRVAQLHVQGLELTRVREVGCSQDTLIIQTL